MKHLTLCFCLCICLLANGQVSVDLSKFDKKGASTATVKGDLLDISWPVSNSGKGRIILDLQNDGALFKSIQLQEENGKSKELTSNLDPAFLLTVGKRDLVKQNGWNIFFDMTAYLPYQSYRVAINKQKAEVVSEGVRTKIIISTVSAGPFSGFLEITLFKGSALMNIASVMSSKIDSLAIIYDAGFVSKSQAWEKILWADPENLLQHTNVQPAAESKELAVKYRTIIGQGREGSLAVFPAPHQYFYPLDNCFNLKFTWFGKNYRNMIPEFGIGIRQDLMGDQRWVPWFNAPPDTRQRLNFFCLLSGEKDGHVLEKVKAFTHGDTYQAIPGYYTMCSHFHQEHIDDVLTHKPIPEVPGFVKALRNTGVNIVHLGEFHLAGNPWDKGPRRLSEFKKLFEECERLSSGNFLLLPGEEPNSHFGGHWMNIFPKPVYWVMSRKDNEPFVAEDSLYRKVYRVGNKDEMLKLLELEEGLAWTAHARTKGSTGFPDNYKEERFYKSDRFLGAAWKAMPADLSQPKLGKRALDLMDDMANWGLKKYVIGETDLFKIEPGYELYGHLNVNYMQMDELPDFKKGWQGVLDAMQSGSFFVSTGEVLLPQFKVNGKSAGETLKLDGRKADVALDISWTFPLNFAEIISGDGNKVYRETIKLSDTEAFGKKTYHFSVNLEGRKWVRVEVWDVAANGAFTQCVWLD